MKPIFKNLSEFKLGILGGGQLGKMLALAAGDWHLNLSVLDKKDAPARNYVSQFVEGDFTDYEQVVRFGRNLDLLTIEIESVCVEALHELTSQGVVVHPNPQSLQIIKDKGTQKSFFQENYIPSAPYFLTKSQREIDEGIRERGWTSIVQKLRTGGYDGRGVTVINDTSKVNEYLEGDSVIEQKVDIHKELSIIVARNISGDVVAYPAVEMVFHPEANLVEFLQCPADIDPVLEKEAQELAKATISAFNICGLLAVEMFLDKSGNLLVNEVAPRPHNSGHHTIEAHHTSQFEQHLRGILNLPLGNTEALQPSVMINILGNESESGEAKYYGIEHLMKYKGAHLHLYGKKSTKPYRKMGHVTITGGNMDELKKAARKLSAAIKAGI